MNKKSDMDHNKQLAAYISIALSIIGCIVSYFTKNSLGSFGAGAIITFIALLASLLSVEEHGVNTVAKIAFFLSVISLFISVGLTAV